MSASEILDEMLGNMPESYQKTIGFPTYDLLAAVSLRMEGTDTTIDEARQQLDPENLHDSALDRYIYPRSGLERKAATFAHGSLTVTGTGTVEQGTLFESGGGVQYYATETVAIEGEGTVPVTCTVDGTAGNLPAHSVTQMPMAVQGIASCDNPDPTASIMHGTCCGFARRRRAVTCTTISSGRLRCPASDTSKYSPVLRARTRWTW